MRSEQPPSARKVLAHFIVVLIFAAWLLPGCKQQSSASKMATDTGPPPNACKTEFASVARSLRLARIARETMAANVGTHAASLARQARQNKAVGLAQRIPQDSEHSDERLKGTIRASAKASAVSIRDVHVGVPSASLRPIPKETYTPFQWTEDDVVAKIPVDFIVESLTPRRFFDWCRSYQMTIPRLLVLKSATVIPGGHLVRGEVLVFRSVTPPAHRLKTWDLEAELARAGINESKCGPITSQVETLRTELDAMRRDEADALRTLATLAMVRLEGVRFEQYEQLRVQARASVETLVKSR